MGESKTGIRGDGTIERLERAGVHGQLRPTPLYVGVPRGGPGGRQGKFVSVRQHDGSSSRDSAKTIRSALAPMEEGASTLRPPPRPIAALAAGLQWGIKEPFQARTLSARVESNFPFQGSARRFESGA